MSVLGIVALSAMSGDSPLYSSPDMHPSNPCLECMCFDCCTCSSFGTPPVDTRFCICRVHLSFLFFDFNITPGRTTRDLNVTYEFVSKTGRDQETRSSSNGNHPTDLRRTGRRRQRRRVRYHVGTFPKGTFHKNGVSTDTHTRSMHNICVARSNDY